jgi:ABC-type phosphate/phosphonate transport system substrate-binding protein
MGEHAGRHHERARWTAVGSVVVAMTALALGVQASPSAAETMAGGAKRQLVVCAPGYPGSTVEAQPAMDALAGAIAGASRWPPGELGATYLASEQAGLARLAEPDAALALVPLTFWLAHRGALKLDPLLQAVREGGEATEPWSLVAAKGSVTGPASLAGWELVSLAANAPRFIRGPALGAWGSLPADVKMVFSGAVLSGLRRAAAGEKVALLLDRAQAAALPSLPLAPQLEVVALSPPLPASVLCAVGGRLPPARRAALLAALPTLGSTPTGSAALAGVRLAGFVVADQVALARARDAYERAPN